MDDRNAARQIAAIFGRSCREPGNDPGLDPALDSAAEVVASVRAEARTEYRVELDAYIRTLRNFRDNWDCDEDAHAHGTTCRACEAADVLSHFARAAILADEPKDMPKCTRPLDMECHAHSGDNCYNCFQCDPISDEPNEREVKEPQVGDACLFWGETLYGIEYDVGLLSLHHNGEYYMRGGIGWKNCRALARQVMIQDITRADGDSREGLIYKSDVDDRGGR